MRRLCLLVAGVVLAGCDSAGPRTATVTFCEDQVVGGQIAIHNDAALFRGNAPWILVDSPDGKSFTFDAPARLTLALTESETPISSNLRMFQLTADELPKLNCIPDNVGALRTYTGTIAGLTTGRSAQLWLGGGVTTRGNGSFTLSNLAPGAADLVSFMRIGNTAAERFIIRRGVDLPSGTALPAFDYASAEAVEPRLNKVTITGGGDFPVRPFNQLFANGTIATLPAALSNGVMTAPSLPTTVQTALDFYVVSAVMNSGGTLPDVRTVSVQFLNPADRTLALGPALAVPTTSYSSTTKPSTIIVTLPVQSEYSARADITLNQSDEGTFRGVTITQTRAYRGGASTWSFETPAPASLAVKSVQLSPDAPTSWIAYAASADYTSLFSIGDGSDITVREAYRDGGVGAGPNVVAGRRGQGPLSNPFWRRY